MMQDAKSKKGFLMITVVGKEERFMRGMWETGETHRKMYSISGTFRRCAPAQLDSPILVSPPLPQSHPFSPTVSACKRTALTSFPARRSVSRRLFQKQKPQASASIEARLTRRWLDHHRCVRSWGRVLTSLIPDARVGESCGGLDVIIFEELDEGGGAYMRFLGVRISPRRGIYVLLGGRKRHGDGFPTVRIILGPAEATQAFLRVLDKRN